MVSQKHNVEYKPIGQIMKFESYFLKNGKIEYRKFVICVSSEL